MPGWQNSKGASLEKQTAEAIGMTIYEVAMSSISLHVLEPETILQEAHRLVNGNRNRDYGSPTENFDRTARMWSAVGMRMHEPRGEVREIEPQDVAVGMCCVKLARLANAYKRDSVTDLAGYAQTLAMCHGD